MKKYTLIKFFRSEATEEEVNSIIAWIEKSPQNKEYFCKLKSIYTATMMDVSAIDIAKGDNIHPDIFTKPTSKKSLGKKILYFSSAAAIAVLFFTMGYFVKPSESISTQSNSNIIAVNKNISDTRTLYTEKGVKGHVVLPDGSKVWLNSDSKLIYPQEFTGDTRNVKLQGEAYFEVVKDSLHPMIVSTNKDFAVEVLGTTFNIKSYDNDTEAETTLYTGAITMHYKDVKTNKVEKIALKPNESFAYVPAKELPKQINHKKPENLKAWKDGDLIFDNTPLTEVFKILERWHGTTFIVKNDDIFKYKLSAEFSSESIIQVMEIMQMIMPFEYSCTNNVVTIDKSYIAPPDRRM